MQCNYNSFIQIINFHGLFRNDLRCRKTGACRILVPLRYILSCFRFVRCITHINKIIFQGCIKYINGIIFHNTPCMKYICFNSCVSLPNLAGWVLIVECECLLMEGRPHGAGVTKSILGVGCYDG